MKYYMLRMGVNIRLDMIRHPGVVRAYTILEIYLTSASLWTTAMPR
jgi:hypothetical protein